MAERELKTTDQWPVATTPLSPSALVEVWIDGKQYYVPYSELGGAPATHAPSHQRDGSDPIGSDDVDAYAIPYLDVNGRIDTRVSDASTTRAGKVMLATDEEVSGTKALAANDSRLTDARTPTAHASSHVGGTDPIPSATTSNDGLMTSSQVATLNDLSGLGSADLGSVLTIEAADLGLTFDSSDLFTHAKHTLAYGTKIGATVYLEHRETPVTWAEAKSTANPSYPEYFPAIPRYDGDHDITTAQAPLLVAELIDKTITVGSASTFSGVLASGVITLSASTDNDNLLIALANAALVNRWFGTNQSATYEASGGLFTGTRQYCLDISGTRYAIEDVDAVARTIDITSPPADGAIDFTIPQYGIAGSTTSIRLRQLSGFVPVACGDYDGDVIEGLAKMDQIQKFKAVLPNTWPAGGGGGAGYFVVGGSQPLAVSIQENGAGTPRISGKTTDPRGYGVAVYTWARTLLARDWT